MKKLLITTVLLSTVSLSAAASMKNDANVKFVGDTQFAGFCKAVVNDDLDQFKRTINRFVGSIGSSRKAVLERVLADNSVTCSGKGLIEFSEARQAQNVAGYLSNLSA